MYAIGVDPGLSGALAIVDDNGGVVALHDTPILTLRVARGLRHDYDVPGMSALLHPYAGQHAHVIIEQSQALPGQGVRSMFTTGYVSFVRNHVALTGFLSRRHAGALCSQPADRL